MLIGKRAICTVALASLLFSPLTAFGLGIPFGGRVTSVIPCENLVLYVGIISARALDPGVPEFYIWTPATITTPPGLVPVPGGQVLGQADIPFVCISPLFSAPLPGLRMQTVGISAPGIGSFLGGFGALLGGLGLLGLLNSGSDQGSSGSGSSDLNNELTFAYSTNNRDEDPGSGKVHFTTSTFGQVSYIYIDDENESGKDVQSRIRTLDDAPSLGSTLRVAQKNNPTVMKRFRVTNIQERSGYFRVSVTQVSSTGSFTSGAEIVLSTQ